MTTTVQDELFKTIDRMTSLPGVTYRDAAILQCTLAFLDLLARKVGNEQAAELWKEAVMGTMAQVADVANLRHKGKPKQ